MRERSVLFWDFDGVIKESVGVKTEAYERLFSPFGPLVAARVREHHERNGGMSRLEKIPLYLTWAGQEATQHEVARYCESFAGRVRKSVIESAWVPGAREYLQANYERQRFVLITATPQQEIEDIIETLGIARCFRRVYGAPIAKAEAIASVLSLWRVSTAEALVIGDSQSDYEAAIATGVEFLLRKTPLNLSVQRAHTGIQCQDFADGSESRD